MSSETRVACYVIRCLDTQHEIRKYAMRRFLAIAAPNLNPSSSLIFPYSNSNLQTGVVGGVRTVDRLDKRIRNSSIRVIRVFGEVLVIPSMVSRLS